MDARRSNQVRQRDENRRARVPLRCGPVAEAAVMLVVVPASNLALEKLVEPSVMGRILDLRPLIVLVVTALGASRRDRRSSPP